MAFEFPDHITQAEHEKALATIDQLRKDLTHLRGYRDGQTYELRREIIRLNDIVNSYKRNEHRQRGYDLSTIVGLQNRIEELSKLEHIVSTTVPNGK